ncbi:MAG TPA: protein kinase, partial [Bdellovibrionota bacterium]|nr:protein kinase [Bdellovibrionota bacterium]
MKENDSPYTLVARLGEGGMAEVFKALKRGPDGFEKPVALKRILPHLADDESFIRMMSAEARIHAHLDHPNLVQILDFFRWGSSYLIALEYVPGKNLRQMMHDARKRETALPWQGAVQILTDILAGLDFAHKKQGPEGPLGVVHRDVNPQNILISYEGLVKLSDFGIAWANVEREITASGVLKGKQRYLSPEQLESKPVDFRADLFSASMVLYELLCERHPFDTGNDFETMKRIVKGEFEPSSQLRADVPQAIHDAISRCLRPKPQDRFTDAAEFRQALFAAQDPAWLGSGSRLLSQWIDRVYPTAADRVEPTMDRTPILSRQGTPLPFTIQPTASVISQVSGLSRAGVTKIFTSGHWIAWVLLGGLAIAGSYAAWEWGPFTGETPGATPTKPTTGAVPTVKGTALPNEVMPASTPAEAGAPTAAPSPQPTPAHRAHATSALPSRRPTPTPKRSARLSFGNLAVDGPLGSKVYINGRLVGAIPL